ncbi:DUF1795 domain-containing protein [Gibbsiella greigii]
MSSPSSQCLFSEGSVTLPTGYSDRTVNVFSPRDAHASSINVSRDTAQENESLSGYVDRQLKLLEQHLSGWKTTDRQPVALGKDVVSGECISASYLRDGKRIWQQQAVFVLQRGSVLVFTQSRSEKLSIEDNAIFRDLLGSFKPADYR